MNIILQISDPWDVGETLGWKHLAGELVEIDSESSGTVGLVRLSSPLLYRKCYFHIVIVSLRHEGDSLGDLLEKRVIAANFVAFSENKLRSDWRRSLQDWQSGLNFIGTIVQA